MTLRPRSATSLLIVVGWVSLVASQPQPASAAQRSLWDGVYTTEQADRGKILYGQYCASCHMPDLMGNPDVPPGQPPTARGFRGFAGGSPPLRGGQFISNWTGLTLKNLFERIRVSMPQSAPGSLSRQRNADILAFILAESAYPSGRQELPSVDAPLDDIWIMP